MLQSEAKNAPKKIQDLWNMLKPLTVEYLSEKVQLVDADYKLINSEAEYAEWERYEFECYGLRHKQTGLDHGVVRGVKSKWILEGTFKDGQAHGLFRTIEEDSIIINLWKRLRA